MLSQHCCRELISNFLEKVSYLNSPQNRVQHFSVRSAVGIPAEKLELRELSSNAAIFTSLPSSERYKPASGYDIVTAEENEDSLLPEPLTSLFDYNAINMEGVLLQEFAVKIFSDCENCFSQDFMTDSQ